MSEKSPRDLVVSAIRAGRFGAPPRGAPGDDFGIGVDAPLEALGFDSLGWMEFCISVELDSGLELTPSVISEMQSLADIEAWLAARLPR